MGTVWVVGSAVAGVCACVVWLWERLTDRNEYIVWGNRVKPLK
jgi:hypothetical protein